MSKLQLKSNVLRNRRFGFPSGAILLPKHAASEVVALRNLRPEVLPAGTLWFSSSMDVPEEWLPTDGAAYNRKLFNRLFSRIGTTFGVGDGATTFNTPNIQRHAITNQGIDWTVIGDKKGAETHGLQSPGELPSHNHPGSSHSHGYSNWDSWGTNWYLINSNGRGVVWINNQNMGTTAITLTGAYENSAGNPPAAGTPHNNIQSGLIVRVLIKY